MINDNAVKLDLISGQPIYKMTHQSQTLNRTKTNCNHESKSEAKKPNRVVDFIVILKL